MGLNLWYNSITKQFLRAAQIRSALADPRSLLPWEEGGLSNRDRRKLGRLWAPMQKLLLRDPVARGSVQQFYVAAQQAVARWSTSWSRSTQFQKQESIAEAGEYC